MAFHSFILHAVTSRTPAKAASGTFEITSPSNNIEAKRIKEWKMLTSLDNPKIKALMKLKKAKERIFREISKNR